MKKNNGPRVLLLDIETSPIVAYVWGLWENNVALNQIKEDWHVLSWSAKWLGEKEVMYADQRKEKDITNDKKILNTLWKLMDEADIILGQNSKKFDVKKLNARFILHGMKPPSSYRQIDTMILAKKHFNFTSNKLEYLTAKLCKKYKKKTKRKFSGFELWKECLGGNISAWNEMRDYNKLDVLSLEELYNRLAPWGTGIDFNVYNDSEDTKCSSCGGTKFQKAGFRYTNDGKYQRLKCVGCGHETKVRVNELSKEKRKSLKGQA